MFLEAPSYRAYGDIRRGVPADSSAIGQGYNLFAPPASLNVALKRGIDQLAAAGRLQQYSCDADMAEKELLARLIGRRLNRPELNACHVFPANGGHEAISMAVHAIHTQVDGIVSPLPCYYAFEQSAMRCGMTMDGHYCERGHGAGPISADSALVDIFANGVSGGIFELPRERGCRVMLLDMTYQIAPPRKLPMTEDAVAARVERAFAHEHCLVVFTPAKDLSIPALRAGLLVTTSSKMAAAIERDRAERSYSVGPLVTRLLLFYFVMLLCYRAHVLTGSARSEMHWIALQYGDLGIRDLPTAEEVEDVIAHWYLMNDLVVASYEVLRSHGKLFMPETVKMPEMGYSCFPSLRKPFRDHESYLGWINRVGREARLKLNPTVMFGGTTETWTSLYEGQFRLRINLSGEASELDRSLRTLAHAVRRVDG